MGTYILYIGVMKNFIVYDYTGQLTFLAYFPHFGKIK
jgi:hypothetical protein